MPFKRKLMKRKVKKVGKKKPYKAKMKAKAKADKNVIFISPGNKAIAPEIAYAKFETQLEFFLLNNVQTGFLVAVAGNNINLPWNTGTLAIGTVANTTITSGAGATATLNPAGYSNWVGGLGQTVSGVYDNWIVNATAIELEVYPQALGDTLDVGLCAFNPQKPGDTPTNTSDFGAKPYSVIDMLGSSKGKSKVKLFVPWHKFMGMTKQAFNTAAVMQNSTNELVSPFGGSYNSAPFINTQIAMFFRVADNANNGTVVTCKAKVVYYCKLYNPRRQTVAII